MIDYEFTIRRLEKELTHYRELQQIEASHLDAHDRSIAALQAIAERTERNIEAISGEVKEIATAVKALTSNVSMLVEALLRKPKNGHGQ